MPHSLPSDTVLRVLGIFDYCVQALLFGLAFIYPWFAPRRRRRAVVLYPLIIAFFWGIWRVSSFDYYFHIDSPGIGYWACGVVLAVIGFLFHCLRWAFTRTTAGSDIQPPTADKAQP